MFSLYVFPKNVEKVVLIDNQAFAKNCQSFLLSILFLLYISMQGN